MFLEARINEITREVRWDRLSVAAVNGDYAVSGFRFSCMGLDTRFNLTAGHWYAVFEDVTGKSHSNPLPPADAGGVVEWEFDDNVTKKGPGVVRFFLKVVVATSGGVVIKRWGSNPASIRVNGSIDYDNDEEEAERESEIDRLAGIAETLVERAEAIGDVERVLENITSSRPQVVSEEENLRNADRDKLAVVAGNGYLYYYDYVVGDWLQMFQYGSGGVELDQTCTDDTKAAPAGEVGRIRARVTTAEGEIEQVKADLDDVNERLGQVEDELGVAPPDVYTGTITEANVNTTIADNLSFERSTQYKYTFTIESAINTNVYIYLRRGGESDSILFSKTIAPGETSVVKLYTTSASYDITEGYILAAANATGVTVNVAIEPAEGVPTRLDDIETDVTAHGTAIDGLTSRTTVLESEVAGIDVSVNRLNPFTVTTGKYIKMDGTQGNQLSLMYTDYIKVNPGERINLVNDGVCDGNTRFRYLTAYDSEKVVIPASGRETSYRYDVPEGVAYIIMTLYTADYAGGKLAINVNAVLAYSAYGDAFPIVNFAQRLKQYPYSTLPDYVLGGAWYKPLGSLSKGYFCMVTDDGRIGMNEYTIPTLVIGKGVKCTFAIMSASEVMADAEKIAVVKDAVDNYGCSVAQHGGNRWTSFNEYQLNEFFDTEKAFFDGVGIEVRGAVIPEHYNSQLIYAVAGGKYGVVRSGYDGHIYPTVCPYANYSNGPRSNLYGLTSYNIVDKTLANNKAAVDSALANHYLMIVYIHENSLDAAKKKVIEGLLDYVNETGITQITLGDIPNII